MTDLVLGVNNAFAIRNWPEPMAWSRIVREELNLRRVQFSFDLLDPTLPEPDRSALCREVVEAVDHYGLELTSTFTGLIIYAQNHLSHPRRAGQLRAQQWFQSAIEVTRKLAAPVIGGHMGAMTAHDFADPQRRAAMRAAVIQSVRDLTQVAAQHGLTSFLWELMPLPREFPHTPQEAIEVLQEVNEEAAIPVRLCFDLGHCGPFDGDEVVDPHQWLEALLPWTPVVHLQQTDGRGDRHWPFTAATAQTGIVDPQRVVEIVRSSPFAEVELLFEIAHSFDTPDQQIIDNYKASVDLWAKWVN